MKQKLWQNGLMGYKNFFLGAILLTTTSCTSLFKDANCEKVHRYPSMGSVLEIQVVHKCSESVPVQLLTSIQKQLFELESELSLYQKNSAISRLNRHGRVKSVSPHFMHLIMEAKNYYRETGGLFNIAIQPALKVQGAPQQNKERLRPLLDPGLIKIGLTQVYFAKKGMAITLDGITKGYAVDLVADKLTQSGYKSHLVNFSGNMRWSGTRKNGENWKVMAWDEKTQKLAAIDTVKYKAVSTSGPKHRPDHLINPLTLKAKKHKKAYSYLGQTALECDVMSTANYVK